jgi:hypothetical protein
MVWINNGNAVATMARITDNIAANTSYVGGSLQCQARGASATASCAYDSLNRRIVWNGTIAPDPGAVNETQALNEIVITFRTTVAVDISRVENKACANWDANGNGSLDEIAQGQAPVCTDDPGTPPTGDSTVWTKQQKVTVPALDEWGMIIFMVFAGLASLYCLRRTAKR